MTLTNIPHQKSLAKLFRLLHIRLKCRKTRMSVVGEAYRSIRREERNRCDVTVVHVTEVDVSTVHKNGYEANDARGSGSYGRRGGDAPVER